MINAVGRELPEKVGSYVVKLACSEEWRIFCHNNILRNRQFCHASTFKYINHFFFCNILFICNQDKLFALFGIRNIDNA